MKKIAIFASGSGSNAENIIQYFAQKPQFCVKSVFCNVPDAYVLERAKKYNVPTLVFNRSELRDPEKMLHQLQADGIDFIILAGFLWLMPSCCACRISGGSAVDDRGSISKSDHQYPSGPSPGLRR